MFETIVSACSLFYSLVTYSCNLVSSNFASIALVVVLALFLVGSCLRHWLDCSPFFHSAFISIVSSRFMYYSHFSFLVSALVVMIPFKNSRSKVASFVVQVYSADMV